MADYTRKTQSENKHLANLTSARFVHLDGGTTTPITLTNVHRILRIEVFAKGVAFTIRNGTRVIGAITTTTPEGDYPVGVYCENVPVIDGISGTGSVLIAFDI